jgi:hypothetical protein
MLFFMLELTRTEIEQIAAKGYIDPVYFCGFFLSEWFPDVLPVQNPDGTYTTSMPWVHRGILAILNKRCNFLKKYGEIDKIIKNFIWYEDPDDETSPVHHIFYYNDKKELKMRLSKYTLILMPRGYSKTTLLNATNISSTLYKDIKFPMYVSKTAKHACKQLSSVAKQLSSNELILAIFGKIKPDQRNENGLKWSESDGHIQTTTGINIVAAGRGGQVRGELDDGNRPDRLTIDDLEDQESTKTKERRADTLDWFISDLLPVLPELNKNATAVMLANLTHSDCLAMNLRKDAEWTTIKIGAIDKDGDPLWPALLSLKELEHKKQSFAIHGKLSRFYMEYLNIVRIMEDAKFRPEFINIAPLPLNAYVLKSLAFDPAISALETADFAASAVVGMTGDGVIQVLECFGLKNMKPREQIDNFFNLHVKFGLTANDKHGIESNAYQAALVHLVREEMFRKNVYFEVIPITHSKAQGSKNQRVEGILQPRYAAGYIHHQMHFPVLETQLLDWPNGKRDLPDALAMAISLLGEVAACASPSDDLSKDVYPPLKEVIGGDWRKYH